MILALNKCFSFTVWWRGRGGRWWGKTTKKLPQATKAYILEVVDWSCPVLCVQEGEEEADEENDPDYDPKVREHVCKDLWCCEKRPYSAVLNFDGSGFSYLRRWIASRVTAFRIFLHNFLSPEDPELQVENSWFQHTEYILSTNASHFTPALICFSFCCDLGLVLWLRQKMHPVDILSFQRSIFRLTFTSCWNLNAACCCC